jgi:hypothetical protein
MSPTAKRLILKTGILFPLSEVVCLSKRLNSPTNAGNKVLLSLSLKDFVHSFRMKLVNSFKIQSLPQNAHGDGGI